MPCSKTGSLSVLYVLENYWPHIGGAENGFRNLCEGMAARGHTVTVVTHLLPGTSPYESINGVAVIRVSSFHNRYFFTFVSISEAYRRARSADLIHTTMFNAAPAACVAGALARKPVLLTVNETWIGRWRRYSNFSPIKAVLHEVLERAILALPFRRYVAISAATAARLTQVVPRCRDRVETIYYGFDREPWTLKSEDAGVRRRLGCGDAFLIVSYGRIGTSKGFEVLMDAFPRIREALPNAHLLLILNAGKQYIRELATLKDRAGPAITFMEAVPFASLPSYIRAADCIVVPSLIEGFGYTTLEAVAAGVPIVASDTGSIPEVIGGRFRLVPPRDVGALAHAVIEIANGNYMTGPEKLFPWKQTIDQYESAYVQLCGKVT
jgi:glycosyltransferase involved in cell wall biosynthesis